MAICRAALAALASMTITGGACASGGGDEPISDAAPEPAPEPDAAMVPRACPPDQFAVEFDERGGLPCAPIDSAAESAAVRSQS